MRWHLTLCLCLSLGALHAEDGSEVRSSSGIVVRGVDEASTASTAMEAPVRQSATPVRRMVGYESASPSGSLYAVDPVSPAKFKSRITNPALEQASLTAVSSEEPHVFEIHDHITIIIREESETRSDSELTTEKKLDFDVDVQKFPHLHLKELLEGQLLAGNAANNPGVKVKTKNKYESEGDYARRDKMTTRLTAEVVDIKPNGVLVLEARTNITNDQEVQTITVTGSCDPDAIAIGNTILSTQLFDLRVAKLHDGELRKATQKGFFTNLLEFIFNF